eukprot:TRINITY_DN9340_c0_g1_i1.p1 TRINITY_DN9340_c0_g1~~TRINITY_DN9340_c0_g1_i1.p1  ORF type:complete len:214 (+),score=26.58 TRINITY_DN9340_c0_g1_i1:244-885(+)
MGIISWNMSISVHLLFLFSTFTPRASYQANNLSFALANYKWPYHAFVWTLSTIHCVILLSMSAFGPASTGCYVTEPLDRLTFVVPQFLFIVSSIIILIYNLYSITNLKKALQQLVVYEQEYDFRGQLIKYTLVFVIFWTFPLVDEILNMTDNSSFYSSVFNSTSISLSAFMNSIVWATNPDFLKLFKRENKSSEEDRLITITKSQLKRHSNAV